MIDPHSKHWVLVAELFSEAAHQASRDLVSDASGRTFHVQGPGSHSKQPRSDPHDQAEEQFTRSLAQKLDKAVGMGKFDHLAIIADPRTLGRLRRHMSKSLAGSVTNELTLDLAGLPLNKLEPRVRSILGWNA